MVRRRREKGQIIIPAMFVFPTLFLFVLLIMDVGLLSREKIRRQFALDAAATIETDQYTDVLNRMAYINGAFPERIFKEAMGGSWHGFWSQGLFPADPSRAAGQEPSDQGKTWKMSFGPARGHINDPNLYYGSEEIPGVIHLNPMGGPANPLYESIQLQYMYMKVYAYIERVSKQQWKVFEETTLDKHAMVRDSLRRNLCTEAAAGLDSRCDLPIDKFAEDEAKPFIKLRTKNHYTNALENIGHCPIWVAAPDGTIYAGTLPFGIPTLGTGRIHQLTTVDPQQVKDMEKQGWEIKHYWEPSPKYFKMTFPKQDGQGIFVYGRVTVSGGSVWPDPTPKFHTRLNSCRVDSDCTGQ